MGVFFNIITVSLNNVEGIKRTLGSLFCQTHVEWKCFVIDGGSYDETVLYLESIHDERLSFCSEADSGIYDAMNKGLVKIVDDCSSYTLFLNSGDVLACFNVLQNVSDELKRFSLPELYYGCYRVSGNERFGRSRSPRFMWAGMPTSHQSVFYRSDVISRLKYNVKYRVGGDYQMTYEVYRSAKSTVCANLLISEIEAPGCSNKYASTGRREWFLIRRDIGHVNIFVNVALYLKNTIGYYIKKTI